MKIITNNQIRPILHWYHLTDKEREQLDTGLEEKSFFRYKREVYCLGDFTYTNTQGWHGVLPETFYSGMLIKFIDDGVIVGRCYT